MPIATTTGGTYKLRCNCNNKAHFSKPRNTAYLVRTCNICKVQAFQCGHCGVFCRRKQNLSRHFKENHPSLYQLLYPFIDRKCTTCNQVNAVPTTRTMQGTGHIIEHSCITKNCTGTFFQCALCYRFVTVQKSLLTKHISDMHNTGVGSCTSTTLLQRTYFW